MHAAVRILEGKGAFPPNTLFRLKHVEPHGFTAPNGVWVNQKLLVVSATFRAPRSASVSSGGGSKMTSAVKGTMLRCKCAAA